MKFFNTNIERHIKILEDEVFKIDSKWPHFKLLIQDLRDLANHAKIGNTIVSMERTLLYGGYSLIGPLFYDQNFISIDCSPESAENRGAYNKSFIASNDFIKFPFSKRSSFYNTGLKNSSVDLLIIPNLVHHVKNQEKLFFEVTRIIKPGGMLYIYEPLVRELHQIPDDYLRYTPYGLSLLLENFGYKTINVSLEGGPFSTVAYCWTQALEYLPKMMRNEFEEWFYKNEFPRLMRLDNEYKVNLCRENTKFPMAFSIKLNKSDVLQI